MRTRATALLLGLVAACGSRAPSPPAGPPAVEAPSAPSAPAKAMTLAESGIVPAWIDPKVDPCTDFFEHACGTFLRTAVIPSDRALWGSIPLVIEDGENLLHEVLEKLAATPGDKVGDYYAACMDQDAIDRAGLTPIQPLLDVVAAIKDTAGAHRAIMELEANGVSVFFGVGPMNDFADATKMIAGFDQRGLGLPDRDYYLKSDGNRKQVRAIYKDHLGRLLGLGGLSPGAAAEVMRLETEIAKLQQDQVVRRDPHAVYHKIDRAGLIKAAPGFPWADYLARLGAGAVNDISVNDPAYYTRVVKLIAAQKPAALRAYMAAHVLSAYAEDLGRELVAEKQVMDQVLKGVKELPPRWRTCFNFVDDNLGELLGQAYVERRFAGTSKARATELTRAILDGMSAQLDALPWMDAETRAAAHRKLARMEPLVGYPDRWRRYDFEVTRASHGQNTLNATRFELARQMAKIGKPVDRTEWFMTPPTVNAYYDPTLNQFVLPAGQLQPPFFGATFHPAVNFGGTGGSTIGHEMTHGFDDEGSQFDADGNLKDWWSAPTKKQFESAAQCVKDQYAQYDAVPGVKVNGPLTSGENIADIGGVKIGYQAYVAWRARQTVKPPAQVEGYTDDQLYFLSYGQSWCLKETPERMETRAHSDPHSPPRWRVNGVVVDQPGFAEAFKCKVGTPMNPGKACSVW